MNPKRPAGLAIEVIGRDGSVAWMKGREVVAARHLDTQSRAASTLIPAIKDLLSPTGRVVGTPDYVAVAIGPGSFTGLRIAVTAAKTLAFAWNVPLVTVDSLAAIAQSAIHARSQSEDRTSSPDPFNILVGLAAYRGQIFRGRFEASSSASGDRELAAIGPVELLGEADWKSELQAIGASTEVSRRWIFAGDRTTFERFGTSMNADDPGPLNCRPLDCRAAGVGRIGAEIWTSGASASGASASGASTSGASMSGALKCGKIMSALDAVPDYFRPSAAEENSSAS